MVKHFLEDRAERLKLAVRKKPYKARVAPGVHLVTAAMKAVGHGPSSWPMDQAAKGCHASARR